MKEVREELDGVKRGDWIRFYQNGALVIGVVQYLYRDVVCYFYAATDIGSVRLSDIFEIRRENSETILG